MDDGRKYDLETREELIEEVQALLYILQPLDTLKCECLDMLVSFKELYCEFISANIHTKTRVIETFKINCEYAAKNIWEENKRESEIKGGGE